MGGANVRMGLNFGRDLRRFLIHSGLRVPQPGETSGGGSGEKSLPAEGYEGAESPGKPHKFLSFPRLAPLPLPDFGSITVSSVLTTFALSTITVPPSTMVLTDVPFNVSTSPAA